MTEKNAIPNDFLLPMQRRRLLFLGYGLEDWNFRVLLRSLNAGRPIGPARRRSRSLGDPAPRRRDRAAALAATACESGRLGPERLRGQAQAGGAMTEPTRRSPPAFCPYKGLRPIHGRRPALLLRPDQRRQDRGGQRPGTTADGVLRRQRCRQDVGVARRRGAADRGNHGSPVGLLQHLAERGLPRSSACRYRRRRCHRPAPRRRRRSRSWPVPGAPTWSWPPAQDEATTRRPAPLVLLFDQFEEFFLYLTGPRERFTQELAELVNRRDLDARVVLSLRDDRLALLEKLAPRIPDILTNRIELEPLDDRGAKDACEKPIEHYNAAGQSGPSRAASSRDRAGAGRPDPHQRAAARAHGRRRHRRRRS